MFNCNTIANILECVIVQILKNIVVITWNLAKWTLIREWWIHYDTIILYNNRAVKNKWGRSLYIEIQVQLLKYNEKKKVIEQYIWYDPINVKNPKPLYVQM